MTIHDHEPRRSRTPVVTFVVGLLLGVAGVCGVLYVTGGTPTFGARPEPAPTVTVTASPTPTPEPQRLPPSCSRLADHSAEVVRLLQEGASAASRLDATALSDVVRRAEARQQELAADTAACRQQTGR